MAMVASITKLAALLPLIIWVVLIPCLSPVSGSRNIITSPQSAGNDHAPTPTKTAVNASDNTAFTNNVRNHLRDRGAMTAAAMMIRARDHDRDEDAHRERNDVGDPCDNPQQCGWGCHPECDCAKTVNPCTCVCT